MAGFVFGVGGVVVAWFVVWVFGEWLGGSRGGCVTWWLDGWMVGLFVGWLGDWLGVCHVGERLGC